MSNLANRLAGPAPEPWRPDVDDVIEGEVVELRETQGQFDPYPMVFPRCEDGCERIVHAFHAALKRELRDQRVQVGDRVAIKFQGTMPGKSWAGYRVLVEHAGRESTSEGFTSSTPDEPCEGGDDDSATPTA